MPAYPAHRAAELLEMSRERLEEAAALRAEVAELLFVARDRLARSRVLTVGADRVSPRAERRGEEAGPIPEDGEATRR